MMKYISIITGSDLRFVMGVNYFIKSFIECNQYLVNMQCNRVYSGKQTIKVDEGESIPIGQGIRTIHYRMKNGVRAFLRKLLTSRFYPFALLKYELNQRNVSRNSVSRFLSDNAPCDYVIFQELNCAYYFFKHSNRHFSKNSVKTLLVIHSEDDTGSMLLNNFHGYGKRDMARRIRKMREFVYERIDQVVFISQKAYNASFLVEKKKSFVYNGSPNIEYKFFDFQQKKTEFVCVGSMTGRKGQDLIIEALHKMDCLHLNRLHVTFIGDGIEKHHLMEKAKKYKIENFITFTGQRHDVPSILGDMDVFIMPSTVEGLPMSAIEALRAGLFLILTDTGGNAELCTNECGLLCTRKPEDILSKMYAVMDGQIISIEQKRRCREHFESNFSLEIMSKGYETVLNSI